MARPIHQLLLLEDDQLAIDSFKRSVEEFNADAAKGATFELRVVRSKDDALELLENCHVDCAVIDLRVPGNTGAGDDAANGNMVIKEILDSVPIPVVVYSGHAPEIDESVRGTPTRVLTKEGGNQAVALNWLAEYSGLMVALADAQNVIKKESARLFHASLWPRWSDRHNKGLIPDPFGPIVARQIAAHLVESLGLSLADKKRSLADEFYFVPSMRERLHTGDLVEVERGVVYVVVTPQCDMVRTYPPNILLARCDPEADWAALEKATRENDGVVSNRSKETIRALVTHKSISAHFIPPCEARGPWNVNFRILITKAVDEVDALMKGRFASISPQFLPNLTSRFAAYLGRYGQPDLDVEELTNYASGRYRP